MPLETASFISQLVSTNPPGSDQVSQGDDHLRLIKTILKTQFPNFTAAALTSTNTQIDTVTQAGVGVTGVLTLLQGALGAPAYSFAGDTNTGIYSPGGDQLTLVTGGTAAITIGASQAVSLSSSLGVLGTLNVSGVATFSTPLAGSNLAAASVTTATIATNAVTYPLIQQVSASRLLGNATGSTANVAEVPLGLGLAFSGSNLANTYTPVAAAFKNLSIKVATNSTVAVAADAVQVTDGAGNFLSVAPSVTIDFTTTGAGGRESGVSLTTNTGYYIWVIAKPDGTTSALANTSTTTIASFPAGYTMKARVGWVHTAVASTNLLGSWQLGRRGWYVVGLASCAALPQLVTGTVGSVSVPTFVSQSLSPFIPATASVARFTLNIPSLTGATVIVAPNNSYGNNTSTTNPAPFSLNWSTGGNLQSNMPFEINLESQAVFYASGVASLALFVVGWEDNI